MSYHGVKFKTKFRSIIPEYDERLLNLIHWCKIFHDYCLAPSYEGGSHGNLSYRLNKNSDEFVITGSKAGLKNELKESSFVRVSDCDIENNTVYAAGTKEPSSESLLHYAIYRARPEINAIFHGHSSIILANYPKIHIQDTEKEQPYGSRELVDSVLSVLGDKDFIIIKNHGFISLGNTMTQAGELAISKYKLLRELNAGKK